ncbi:MAG TPA: ribonuclease E inhibitor RraB [Steroidobacteraceae bacterium]|nr:ribonuclease E inhibitor RraB [Steroidobacteraceae bacterium]
MQWMLVFAVLAALLAVVRVISAVRRTGVAGRRADWDERLIKSLRAQGRNLFEPQSVDFFLDLPDPTACAAAEAELLVDGFKVDYRPLAGEGLSEGYSLHASKQLRVSVTEIHEQSQRFTALAAKHGGQYDGWAVAGLGRQEKPPH